MVHSAEVLAENETRTENNWPCSDQRYMFSVSYSSFMFSVALAAKRAVTIAYMCTKLWTALPPNKTSAPVAPERLQGGSCVCVAVFWFRLAGAR